APAQPGDKGPAHLGRGRAKDPSAAGDRGPRASVVGRPPHERGGTDAAHRQQAVPVNAYGGDVPDRVRSAGWRPAQPLLRARHRDGDHHREDGGGPRPPAVAYAADHSRGRRNRDVGGSSPYVGTGATGALLERHAPSSSNVSPIRVASARRPAWRCTRTVAS